MMWFSWSKRAELAQSEINKEREQATEYYVDCEHLKEEINDLKQKLARYENPDYVLVPREPTKEVVDVADSLLLFHASTLESYKAMIEAVEKDDE